MAKAPAGSAGAAPGNAGAKVAVTIKATGGNFPGGTVRAVGQPVPEPPQVGPDWKYQLAPGKYIVNADFDGIAPGPVKFAFTGATPRPPTSFAILGTPGQFGASNRDISFTVP
jgi:hypothetical protein